MPLPMKENDDRFLILGSWYGYYYWFEIFELQTHFIDHDCIKS